MINGSNKEMTIQRCFVKKNTNKEMEMAIQRLFEKKKYELGNDNSTTVELTS